MEAMKAAARDAVSSPSLSMVMRAFGRSLRSCCSSWIVYGWFVFLLGTEPSVIESPIARMRMSVSCRRSLAASAAQLLQRSASSTAAVYAAAVVFAMLLAGVLARG